MKWAQGHRECGPYDRVDELVVSRNSWGFRAERGGKHYVVINGEERGPYDYVWKPLFSLDGSAWGFLARKSGIACTVINGREFGPYDDAEFAGFGPDGSALFYTVTRTKTSCSRVEKVEIRIPPG